MRCAAVPATTCSPAAAAPTRSPATRARTCSPGGSGNDTANYALEVGGGPVVVNLTTGGQTDIDNDTVDDAGETAQTARDSHGTEDTLSSIEKVEAGNGYDDTVILDGVFSNWTLTFDGGTGKWTATGVGGPATGQSYTFDGVEKLVFQNVAGTQGDEQTVHLVDPTQAASAYLSIEDAIAHAASGDTIVVAAGTYNDNLTITKDVTIVGPNAGKLLADTRNAEASIGGLVTIVADGVTIDGVKFAEGALSAWTGRPTAIVLDNDATGLTVTSSLFARTGGGNSSGIETYYGGNNDNLTVTNSSFSGWNIAIYLNPGADNAVITDNAFSNGGGVATDEPNGVQIGANAFTGDSAHIGMTDSASGFDADFANGGPVAAGYTFTAILYDADIGSEIGAEGQVLNGTALRDLLRKR